MHLKHTELASERFLYKNRNGMNLGIHTGDLASFISFQKANMIEPNDSVIIDERVSYVDGVGRQDLQEAYRTYERLKSNSRQIDFDDMLLYLYKKLKNDSTFRAKLNSAYSHILVDEFQDTSKIVIDIIKMINNENVYVVGDFRQSIYAFNNADVNNILNFSEEFEDVTLIELNKNFRSTQNIVELSNKIIDCSPIEKYKNFKHSESVSEIGKPIEFTMYQDDMNEFSSIANMIQEYSNNGVKLKEIAILVRTNAQTALIETMLADRDIPYEVSKSLSFFDRKEVLDILSYVRLAMDEDDDASFRRVYNSPNRFLSKESLEKLDEFASSRDISLMEACKITPQNADWKFKKNIEGLIAIIEDLKYQVQYDVNAGKVLRNAIKLSKYENFINDNAQNPTTATEKLDAINKLCEIGAKFPSPNALMAHISKIKDKQEKSKGKDSVQISTIHSAKGLEYDIVFVPSCVEGLLPHEMSEIEEERRLFYVACSRPRKELYVSWFAYDSELNKVKHGLFVEELLGEDKVLAMNKEVFRGCYSSTSQVTIENNH